MINPLMMMQKHMRTFVKLAQIKEMTILLVACWIIHSSKKTKKLQDNCKRSEKTTSL